MVINRQILLCTISGHLNGIALGLEWHVNAKNKQAIMSAIKTLKEDAAILMDMGRTVLNEEPD